jgi:hypothetical protein
MCDHARAFSTRPRGAELAAAVRAAAGDATEHVEVDFSGVLAVSYSFIDQFMHELDASSASEGWSFTFSGMAPSVERVLLRNCASRGVEPKGLRVG